MFFTTLRLVILKRTHRCADKFLTDKIFVPVDGRAHNQIPHPERLQKVNRQIMTCDVSRKRTY